MNYDQFYFETDNVSFKNMWFKRPYTKIITEKKDINYYETTVFIEGQPIIICSRDRNLYNAFSSHIKICNENNAKNHIMFIVGSKKYTRISSTQPIYYIMQHHIKIKYTNGYLFKFLTRKPTESREFYHSHWHSKNLEENLLSYMKEVDKLNLTNLKTMEFSGYYLKE